MYVPISVCVPAYNEERTVRNTLDSLVHQSYPGKMEILVCANGCTDRTEDIVAQMGSQYPNIKLISTHQRGKPNAWNMLRNAASSNLVFFIDADVVFSNDAVKQLYGALQDPNIIASTGDLVPVTEGRALLTRAMTPPSGNPGCLVGALYGFRNDALAERMKQNGFSQMPVDIISEDAWVTLVVGRENWVAVHEAKIYFAPYEWRESFRMAARYVRGRRQLQEGYPALYAQGEDRLSTFRRRYNKLMNVRGASQKIQGLLGYILKYAVIKAAQSVISHEKLENALAGWEISEASKVPLSPPHHSV